MRKMMSLLKTKSIVCYTKIGPILSGKEGSGYIEQAISILLAVVLGALLLAGLYALFGDVVLPRLEQEITRMFNYAG